MLILHDADEEVDIILLDKVVDITLLDKVVASSVSVADGWLFDTVRSGSPPPLSSPGGVGTVGGGTIAAGHTPLSIP